MQSGHIGTTLSASGDAGKYLGERPLRRSGAKLGWMSPRPASTPTAGPWRVEHGAGERVARMEVGEAVTRERAGQHLTRPTPSGLYPSRLNCTTRPIPSQANTATARPLLPVSAQRPVDDGSNASAPLRGNCSRNTLPQRGGHADR